ncbi:hypothetical protein H6P81_016539 [Aristolochia fimbriata]|uniref:Uncharacterized protein n=1 Tax=Aristolochia fimbriata TaxID=158543 RepID=A0AAV7E995_ARIFI|nr:hypothetical protein H6P81_016539 [Aristolochia fimbriata]
MAKAAVAVLALFFLLMAMIPDTKEECCSNHYTNCDPKNLLSNFYCNQTCTETYNCHAGGLCEESFGFTYCHCICIKN